MGNRKSIYDPLHRRLADDSGETVRLTFAEVEAVLQRPPPPSAYKFNAWCGERSAGSAAKSWATAGFKAKVSMKDRVV